MILMIDIRDIWNVIYNARSNKHHPPTSPNTAPATEKESHLWSSSHMKRHLQCAEQQASPSNLTNAAPATKNDAHHSLSWHMQRHLQCAKQQASPSNLTKYCACHAKVHSKIKEKFAENSWSVNSNAGTIRAWSEHDPNMNPNMNSSSRTRPFGELTFRASETHFVLKITTFRAPAIYPNFTKYCACHEKWHSKITKYCACHAKWLSWLMSVTHDTSFTMRGATDLILQHHQMLRLPRKMTRIIYPRDITRQPHQILRLPRKMTLMIDLRHIWNVIYHARSNRHHPPTSPNTAPATQKCTPKSKRNSPKTVEASIPMRGRSEHDPSMIRTWSEHDPNMNPNMNSSSRTRLFGELTFRTSETHFVLKITTFRAPAIYPNFTKYCACHEKWHSKITKYCACHEKWHSDITKCCACHEKWHSDITKYCACHEKWDCHWTVTELSCYEAVTELLLSCYWTVTELNCYSTVTELWLNWPVTELLLNCYWYSTVTELTCYWTVTELTCYWAVTELLLLLHCYLNCCCTGLFAFLNLRNSEVSQLNFLWWRHCLWMLGSLY